MQGEDEEFDAFFRRDYAMLVRHLALLGYDVQIAKDAAQQAMTQAYERWATILDPRAWVRSVAKRMASRLWQQEALQQQRAVVAAERRDTMEPEPLDPYRQWELKEDQRAILDALRALPQRQQEVMAWSLDGFRPAEIAEHLDMAPATVRSHLRHARAALKETWNRSHGEEGCKA